VEESDKRVHAIQFGLVPLDLDRQDASPSPSCAASVQWRSNPTVHESFFCEALRRELHGFLAVCFFPCLDFLRHLLVRDNVRFATEDEPPAQLWVGPEVRAREELRSRTWQ